jgi:hypothetical protein
MSLPCRIKCNRFQHILQKYTFFGNFYADDSDKKVPNTIFSTMSQLVWRYKKPHLFRKDTPPLHIQGNQNMQYFMGNEIDVGFLIMSVGGILNAECQFLVISYISDF